MFTLRYQSSPEWVNAVISNFDLFLNDHAAAEKKASGMAMSMLSHYPDREKLVASMIDLAMEELAHFREVVKIMTKRGLILGADKKDPYVNKLRKCMRQGSDVYMLDRLIIGGVIEARGHERFSLISDALEPGELKDFYAAIAESESRHHELFIDLAKEYFEDGVVEARLNKILDIEAEICASLPIQAALH
jgi:tRNA-(ms[2]io[6]A)-hydroxylase